MEDLCALLAATLRLQDDAGASAPRRLGRSLRSQWQALVGPRGYRRKTVAALLVALLGFLSLAEGEYRLSAPAQVEPAFQRVVTVPYDGFLAAAQARPGDEVRAGQVLLRLDDRELHLERVRWLTEAEKLRKRHQQAVAARDRASLAVLKAQLEQAEAQLALMDSQLARVEVAAPFDGLIVSGDPTLRLGDALRKGEVVHQIAPLDAYRVAVRVAESRIGDLAVGMRGTLQLAAVPGLALDLTVERIHPFTQRRDGQSHFVVECSVQGPLQRVRPGMEGVASLAVDRRLLASIWSRGLMDWLRTTWWKLAG